MPLPPRPRAYSREPHPWEQLGEPGTTRQLSDGTVVLFADLALRDDEARVRQLARDLRYVRAIEVVGEPLRACWSVRSALNREWTVMNAELRAAEAAANPKPPLAPRKPRERCGAPRRGGGPCRAWAGAGTGGTEGPCIAHGGDRSVLEAEMEIAAEAAHMLVRTWGIARARPLTPVEELAQLTAMRAVASYADRRRRRRRS